MALTSFSGSRVRKQDVIIAKNYLTKDDIDTLNRLVVIFLEEADLRVKQKKELTVKDKGDKETTYKITESVTFKAKNKDGEEKEMPHEKGVARLEKIKEGSKQKFDVETEKKDLKSLTFRAGKKKN